MYRHHYSRQIYYYETDKMGVTHHSNYIRLMEEARVDYLNFLGIPFTIFEARGIVSPVTAVNAEYRHPTTFGDTVAIELWLEKYTGVQYTVAYRFTNADTGELVAEGSTRHCFMKNGRICSLKREAPDLHERFEGKQLDSEE